MFESFKKPARYEIVAQSNLIGRQRAAVSKKVRNCRYPVIDECLAEYQALRDDIPTPEQLTERLYVRRNMDLLRAVLPPDTFSDLQEILSC